MFETGIVPSVLRHVPAGSNVAELYAGIGLIGVNAASQANTVFCSDSNEYVDEVFEEVIDSLQNKVSFLLPSAPDATSLRIWV
jgi:tRNA G37 N-methylase Trm5